MKILPLLLLLGLSTCIACAQAPAHITVAADGSAQYTSIQAAIDAVPDMRKAETVIFIKKGTYREKIVVPESKPMLTLVGEDAAQTIIVWNNYASKKNIFGEEMGTSGSATMYVFAPDFTAANLTIQNDAGPVGQAVALFAAADRMRLLGCRLLGHQDTLYTYKVGSRQYYFKCYIEGTTDFIFGAATAYFDSCTLYGKQGGHYYTAASTPEHMAYGYVFSHCQFTGNAPQATYYLGRPWRPYAKTALLNCQLDAQVKPEGWHNWNKQDAERTSYYAEYKSQGHGSAPGQRVAWAKTISDAEALLYTPQSVFHNWAVHVHYPHFKP
jgi:pectinesterase